MSKARVERNIYRGPAKPELGGVSLVFPVRNESFMIEMTLRNYSSELRSRIADFELIVAEDGSTDDTKSVLERLEKELSIRLFTSDELKGYQKALIDAVPSRKRSGFLLSIRTINSRRSIFGGSNPCAIVTT